MPQPSTNPMKKILIAIAIIAILLIGSLLAIPSFFKDDIKKLVDEQIDANLNAKVNYNVEDISLTLFEHFPNVTFSISDLSITGREVFESDTLVSFQSFSVTVDIASAFSGGFEITDIDLIEPKVKVLVLADGRANYDIAKASEVETSPDEENVATESGDFKISIHDWSISNASVIYDDRSLPLHLSLNNLNHEGHGAFEKSVFDMNTKTSIDKSSLSFDGVEYITNKFVGLDAVIGMDLENMKFTFKENIAKISDLAFTIDGDVTMPSEDIDIDLNYHGTDISLKSILSLIPGLYQEYLAGVTALGKVGFDGIVKGTYNENSMPQVKAGLTVGNGKISYADYPVPVDQIDIDAVFDYPSADLKETSFSINRFSMLLDGEKIISSLKFKDLEDYKWDFVLNGKLDLGKLTKIVPVEGSEIKGIIHSKFSSKGVMSDVENQKYDELETEGQVLISDFYYKSKELTDPFTIKSSDLTFDLDKVQLNSFSAGLGSSDFQLTGMLENFIPYALKGNTLVGELDFKSGTFDVNPFLPEEEEETVEAPVAEDTSTIDASIPENIDFKMMASVNKLLYDKMTLEDMKGLIVIKDGKLSLDNASFRLLEGQFAMTGFYTTKDVSDPLYDFQLDINDLSIPAAFDNFSVVEKFMPLAKNMTGKFSTDFKISGVLDKTLMPIYDKMQGKGLVNVKDGELKQTKLTSSLASVSKLGGENENMTFKDILVETKIKDGRIHFAPFNINMSGRQATVSGSNGIDGSIDYRVKMDVPATQLASLASSFGLKNNLSTGNIKLNLQVGGTYDSPKIGIASAEPGDSNATSSVTTVAKVKAKAELDKKKAEAEAKARAEAERRKQIATKKAAEERKKAEQAAKKEAEKVKKAAEEEKKKAIKRIKGLF